VSPDAALGFDQRFLKTRAYGDDANLSARQAIYRYQDEPFDFQGWALSFVPWRGDEVVVDVGCGNGHYLRRIAGAGRARLNVGLDLSVGMLTGTLARWPDGTPVPPTMSADAQHLPLGDSVADVVLAMHMLYHVPDIASAIGELRRVVRPGGTLLAAANGRGGLAELYKLRWDAIAAVAGRPVEPWSWFARFNVENGVGLLREAFDQVDVHVSERELHVPEPGPVVAFLDSQSLPADVIPPGIEWNDVVAEMHRRAAEQIDAEGTLRVSTRMGVFVCR
jgi:SAM-dependent methyltransferase